MPDDPTPTPAQPADIADALAYALNFSRGKRKHDADEAMARIVAARLVEHLQHRELVVMKAPSIAARHFNPPAPK